MLENSYDASGIKFGILLSKVLSFKTVIFKKENDEIINNTIKEILKSNNYSIIDFNEIDGLSLDEILRLDSVQAKNMITFIAYNEVKYEIGNSDVKRLETSRCFKYFAFVKRTNENKNNLIDKEVEKIMLHDYQDSNTESRNVIKCFLQRHRYGTKENTNNAINEYIKSKKISK